MAIYKKMANNSPDRFVRPVTDVHTSNKHVSYNKTIYIPHVTTAQKYKDSLMCTCRPEFPHVDLFYRFDCKIFLWSLAF